MHTIKGTSSRQPHIQQEKEGFKEKKENEDQQQYAQFQPFILVPIAPYFRQIYTTVHQEKESAFIYDDLFEFLSYAILHLIYHLFHIDEICIEEIIISVYHDQIFYNGIYFCEKDLHCPIVWEWFHCDEHFLVLYPFLNDGFEILDLYSKYF